MASLTVGNHGDGPQTSHSGSGGQSVNSGTGFISTGMNYHIANLSSMSKPNPGVLIPRH